MDDFRATFFRIVSFAATSAVMAAFFLFIFVLVGVFGDY